MRAYARKIKKEEARCTMTKVLIINNERNKNNLGIAPRIQQALNQGDKVNFEILHYTEISKEKIEEIYPDMICLTGRLTYAGNLQKGEYAAELELIRNTDIPLFGICLGHQLIAIAHGATLGKMVEVPHGEENIREDGYTEINIQRPDLLFNGIENYFSAYEYHLEEVKEVPKNFNLLASSEMCKVQAIKHKEKLIYGVQFHPEGFTQEYPAGEGILQNFFAQASVQVIPHVPAYTENIEAATF